MARIATMRPLRAFSLIAAFSILVALVAGGSAGATAPGAHAAKKCKSKKKGHKASAAKKKKCKAKKKPGTTPAAPGTIRATLIWSGGHANTSMGLFVFDQSGDTSSDEQNQIIHSTRSPAVTGASGTVTFT